MNCPKHNYCVEMERYRYSIDEFLEQFGDKLISANSVKDFFRQQKVKRSCNIKEAI